MSDPLITVSSQSQIALKIENGIKSQIKIKLLACNACLGGFLFGYIWGVYNSLQATIHIIHGWDENSSQTKLYDGIITSCVPIGCMLGAIISKNLIAKLGRKNTLILIDFIAIGSLCLTIYNSSIALIIGRSLTGVMIGINSCTVPGYVNEMSPKEISGKLGAYFQIFINIGMIVSYILGMGIPSNAQIRAEGDLFYVRFMLSFPAITCIIRILVLIFIFPFDTPHVLIQKNQIQQAKDALGQIYHFDQIEGRFEIIQEKLVKIHNVSFKELFSNLYMNRLCVACALPIIRQLCGSNAIAFYSQNMFETNTDGSQSYMKNIQFIQLTHNEQIVSRIFTIAVGVMYMVGAIIGGHICDRFGRKDVLLFGTIGVALTLALMGGVMYLQVTKWVTDSLILLYCLLFGSGLGTVTWLYLPEIVPDSGLAVAGLANFLFAAFIGFFFPIMKNSILQLQGSFLMFSGFTFFGAIFVMIMVQETKGKTGKQIVRAFQRRNHNSNYNYLQHDQILDKQLQK